MKIKYRITLLFTFVVTLILLLVCSSVYYFSNLNRQKTFNKRLRNRALTTANLLLKVNGIDNQLLRKIDETTIVTIEDKSVVIYDSVYKERYSYTDNNIAPVRVDSSILKKVNGDKEYTFTDGLREAIVLYYKDDGAAYTVVAAAFDKDGREKIAQLQLILTVSFFSGILITFIFGLIFSSGIVLPIKKITKEVKEISSKNLSRRIDLHDAKDELYELSLTFNDLLTRLEESFEMQRHFIANASHELSTPLTSISSQLEITLQNERSSDDYKAVINSVYDDVKDITLLTRSLLEIAKASATSDGMELTMVRIDELLLKLPADLKKMDPQYQVEMHFDNFPDNEENLSVFGNPDLLYSAVKNIVLNACKYGTDHRAFIVLRFTDSEIHISCQDNGPGISEEDKELIFQPFYRGQRTQDIHGFGLGLSLALRIISLHKGSIQLVSPTGGGALFSIRLPIAREFHKL